MGAQVRQHQLAHLSPRLPGAAGGVRGQHHLIHPQQFGWHVWLTGEHVQARAAQLSCLQSRHQRAFIDDAAARDVDQDTARSQRLQHRRVHDGPCTLAARRRHDQHVHLCCQFQQPRHVTVRQLRVRAAVGVQHRHVERHQPPRHRLPHPAQPDDARFLPAQPRGEQHLARLRPLARPHVAVPVGHPAGHGQQQRQPLIGHVVREHARRAADHDAAPRTFGQVDGVQAHSVDGDHLQLRQGGHDFRFQAHAAVGRHPPDVRAVRAQVFGTVCLLPEAVRYEPLLQRLHDKRHHRGGDEQFGQQFWPCVGHNPSWGARVVPRCTISKPTSTGAC